MKMLKAFVDEHRITMACTLTDSNPNMADMPAGSTHWRCVLRRGNKRLTTPFSMGPAHRSEPTVQNVLGCLASDAAGIENNSNFEDWCGEYGYDTDSRKGERVFRAVKAEQRKLRQFLGDELYSELVWSVERE